MRGSSSKSATPVTPSNVTVSLVPEQRASSPISGTPPPVKITFDDIANEVKFWKSSVVRFVLGANPPLHVIEGFVRRIWQDHSIDKLVWF